MVLDLDKLEVGNEIAIDTSSPRSYRCEFHYGKVTRTTKQFVEVEINRFRYNTNERVPANETYKFSKASGKVMGDAKGSYCPPRLCSAADARSKQAYYAEMDRARKVEVELQAALLAYAYNMFGDTTPDALRALADSIEAERALRSK